MSEINGNENPVSRTVRKNRKECTAAKFFKDAEKLIAEADRSGTTDAALENIAYLDAGQPDELLHLGKNPSPLQIRHDRAILQKYRRNTLRFAAASAIKTAL